MSEPISIQQKQSHRSITSGKERWLNVMLEKITKSVLLMTSVFTFM